MATHLPPAPTPPAAVPPVAAPGWSGQQHYPPPPTPPIRGGRRRSLLGLWILAGTAAIAAIAALVLSVIAVVAKPSEVRPAPTTSAAPAPAAPILFDDDADRLRSSFRANLNGDQFISDPHTRLRASDCVLILSADAGG